MDKYVQRVPTRPPAKPLHLTHIFVLLEKMCTKPQELLQPEIAWGRDLHLAAFLSTRPEHEIGWTPARAGAAMDGWAARSFNEAAFLPGALS